MEGVNPATEPLYSPSDTLGQRHSSTVTNFPLSSPAETILMADTPQMAESETFTPRTRLLNREQGRLLTSNGETTGRHMGIIGITPSFGSVVSAVSGRLVSREEDDLRGGAADEKVLCATLDGEVSNMTAQPSDAAVLTGQKLRERFASIASASRQNLFPRGPQVSVQSISNDSDPPPLKEPYLAYYELDAALEQPPPPYPPPSPDPAKELSGEQLLPIYRTPMVDLRHETFISEDWWKSRKHEDQKLQRLLQPVSHTRRRSSTPKEIVKAQFVDGPYSLASGQKGRRIKRYRFANIEALDMQNRLIDGECIIYLKNSGENKGLIERILDHQGNELLLYVNMQEEKRLSDTEVETLYPMKRLSPYNPQAAQALRRRYQIPASYGMQAKDYVELSLGYFTEFENAGARIYAVGTYYDNRVRSRSASGPEPSRRKKHKSPRLRFTALGKPRRRDIVENEDDLPRSSVTWSYDVANIFHPKEGAPANASCDTSLCWGCPPPLCACCTKPCGAEDKYYLDDLDSTEATSFYCCSCCRVPAVTFDRLFCCAKIVDEHTIDPRVSAGFTLSGPVLGVLDKMPRRRERNSGATRSHSCVVTR